MSETRRIADQLRRAFQGEAWHGPSVKEALAGVTARQAAGRPIAAAHTIWEIAAHIAVWENAILKRLQGQIVQPQGDEDWPPTGEGGERAWAELLARLETGNRALCDAILALDESRLDESPGANRPTLYVLLHGILQHDLYHAGQIALLKKGVA